MGIARSLGRRAKNSMLSGAELVGINRWLKETTWRRQRLLILCYHGVSLGDEHLWSDLYVDEDHLRHRFSLLKSGSYNVLPLSEAIERLRAVTLPERSVAITFDDGAYDFFAKAYPLLQEFGFHATLYLTTYYCSYQKPVFDTVASYLLWKGKGGKADLGDGRPTPIPLDTAGRQGLHERLRSFAAARRLSGEEKNRLARRISEQLGVDYDEILERRLLHLMNPAEIASLATETVSLQLHTHRHRTPLDRELFLREIRDNRSAIQAMRPGDEPLEHFCYPSGHYEESFLEWLPEVGVESATTCEPRIATRASHPLLLPRLIDTMKLSDAVFESWLSGTATFLSAAKR